MWRIFLVAALMSTARSKQILPPSTEPTPTTIATVTEVDTTPWPGSLAPLDSITVACEKDNMHVTISLAHTEREIENSVFDTFNGIVYPAGLGSNSSCLRQYVSARGDLQYTLPLRGCNTMSTDHILLVLASPIAPYSELNSAATPSQIKFAIENKYDQTGPGAKGPEAAYKTYKHLEEALIGYLNDNDTVLPERERAKALYLLYTQKPAVSGKFFSEARGQHQQYSGNSLGPTSKPSLIDDWRLQGVRGNVLLRDHSRYQKYLLTKSNPRTLSHYTREEVEVHPEDFAKPKYTAPHAHPKESSAPQPSPYIGGKALVHQGDPFSLSAPSYKRPVYAGGSQSIQNTSIPNIGNILKGYAANAQVSQTFQRLAQSASSTPSIQISGNSEDAPSFRGQVLQALAQDSAQSYPGLGSYSSAQSYPTQELRYAGSAHTIQGHAGSPGSIQGLAGSPGTIQGLAGSPATIQVLAQAGSSHSYSFLDGEGKQHTIQYRTDHRQPSYRAKV